MLVENYQLTTPVGLRIGREFLNKTSMKTLLVFSLSNFDHVILLACGLKQGLGEGFVVWHFACAWWEAVFMSRIACCAHLAAIITH